jgi:hypothetical protein
VIDVGGKLTRTLKTSPFQSMMIQIRDYKFHNVTHMYEISRLLSVADNGQSFALFDFLKKLCDSATEGAILASCPRKC